MRPQTLAACRHCGTVHVAVALEPGGMAACTCCGYALYRRSRYSLNFWTALALTALVVFAIANLYPIARIGMLGKALDVTFVGALWMMWNDGHFILAAMTGLVGFWFPLTEICFLYWALGCIRRGRLPADFKYAMRVYDRVGHWSMVPVLMLSIIVSIVKFAGLSFLEPRAGIWAFGVLTFMLTAFIRLDSRRLWRYAEEAGLAPAAQDAGVPPEHLVACDACGFVQAERVDGSPCVRCEEPVHRRKPNMRTRVWAFLIAAAVVYVPANVLPMMEIRSAMGDSVHTILGGVLELWRLGSWDLAIIVFVASVVVPITKLVALAVLMMARQWRGRSAQRQRTRLYELVEFIGQWSMLDVFVVVLMAAMANFPGVSQVIAGPAAASFGMVVILTMFAAMSYDPRTGWDQKRRATGGTISNDRR